MIPESFWLSLESFITLLTIVLVFYFLSKVYKNIFLAHKKHNYVENHNHWKLQNCTLLEPEEVRQ